MIFRKIVVTWPQLQRAHFNLKAKTMENKDFIPKVFSDTKININKNNLSSFCNEYNELVNLTNDAWVNSRKKSTV